jgi:hypothetical protein
MNKSEFVRGLRAAAAELEPLARTIRKNTAVWNGASWVKGLPLQEPSPYAAAWLFALTTLADILELQEFPLSDRQIAYFKQMLFGGMGSLTDLKFDWRKLGPTAKTVNERLSKRTEELYTLFQSDCVDGN